MLDSIRDFFAIVDVDLGWPVFIIILLFVNCLVPYEPIAKMKKTKDEDGNIEYTIYKYRK